MFVSKAICEDEWLTAWRPLGPEFRDGTSKPPSGRGWGRSGPSRRRESQTHRDSWGPRVQEVMKSK
jgi:hypothetical protein